MQLKNVAAVTVTAELPPFAKTGQTIDITVASIGNATSLRGGALLMTPLRGADGEVYAMAQGSVMVSGFGVAGKDGSRVSVNVPSGGRIPNGATVEREVPNSFGSQPFVMLESEYAGFHHRLARSPTRSTRPSATAARRRSMRCRSRCARRPMRRPRVAFIGELQELEIEPGEAPARVIINSRTGTVVIGSRVRVTAGRRGARIAVGDDHRTHRREPAGAVLHGGNTVVTPRSEINVTQADARMFVFDAGVNLDEIVRAVNQVGAAPGDLVAILEALKQAGALRAELIVI